ncbi:hypothetical protein ACFE04_011840 [Oxalis oulophora]
MGTIISKAANAIGAVLGNSFVAPFKNIFGASCEELCSGPWDLVCFIEHLCVSNLLKLLLIPDVLLPTVQDWDLPMHSEKHLQDVLGRLHDLLLKNTKRVNRRRRFKDIERGCSSSTTSESEFSTNLNLCRKRKLTRESKGRHNRHHVKLKTREVSIRVKGRSSKGDNSRRMQLISKVRNPRREIGFIKRRRLK